MNTFPESLFDEPHGSGDAPTGVSCGQLRYMDVCRPLFQVDHAAARRCVGLAMLNDEAARRSYDRAVAAGQYPKLAVLKASFDEASRQWNPQARWEPRARLVNGHWEGEWRGAWKTPVQTDLCDTRKPRPIPGPADGVLELDDGGHLRRVAKGGGA